MTRFGAQVLGLRDPDGLGIELVAEPGLDGSAPDASQHATRAAAPHAVRRLHSVALCVEAPERTARLLTDNAGCALAPDLLTFSLLRFVAAFGGSASMVIPRAIVRDLADGHAAARLMSRLMLVMGVAPTLGGTVLGFASWHAIFWLTVAYGTICCLLVWRRLPDTLPVNRRVPLGMVNLATRYSAPWRGTGCSCPTLSWAAAGCSACSPISAARRLC